MPLSALSTFLTPVQGLKGGNLVITQREKFVMIQVFSHEYDHAKILSQTLPQRCYVFMTLAVFGHLLGMYKKT